MPSLTVENYLKAILQIGLRSGAAWVATGKLAEALGVLPGTVTSMQKTLAEAGLAEYRPYSGVRLTESGRSLALRMVRRHRLIELFLVRTLDLTWDQVHEEAENMEHAVSDFLVDRIDEYLGHPQADPHGDPIPSADGDMRGQSGSTLPLTECENGARVRIVRVVNQETEFLRYLSEAGIELGIEATVKSNNPAADILALELASGRTVSLAHQAARQLLTRRVRLEGDRAPC